MILQFLLEMLLALVAIFLCRLGYFIYRRVRLPDNCTLQEALPFLRPVDRDEVEQLVDGTGEHFLRLNLGELQFRREQRKRVLRMLEQAGRMAHNAGYLREWARRERSTAWTNSDEELKASSERLICSCIQVRGGARAIQTAIHLWLIKSRVYPPAGALYLSALRKIDSFDLILSYEGMADAAMELSQPAAPGLQEALAERL